MGGKISMVDADQNWITHITIIVRRSKTAEVPFTNMDGILIHTWITNHMPSKVWDEIIYPYENFNS